MKSYLKYLLILSFFSVNLFAQLGGSPGAFTRMGLNARGIAMGNALSSVIWGDLNGFYNPALSAFQNQHLINLSYSFLTLDRALNHISYTKNFKLRNQSSGGAGVTFSWLNAGVSKIDGRDIDGFSIGELSTFDNQFLFAPSIMLSDKVSLGIGFKFYYSKLFDGVTSTSFGFDIGAIYRINNNLNLAITAKDFNSKYEWNTQNVYGQNGNQTKEKFPRLYTIALSLLMPNNFGIAALEFQTSNKRSNIFRVGIEFFPIKDLKLRAGLDRFDINAEDIFGSSRPSFGIGYQRDFKNYTLGIDYSLALEPFNHSPFQTITAVFKLN